MIETDLGEYQDTLLMSDAEISGLPGYTVGDFWSWAYSDLMSNRNRGIFAEFIVSAALGVVDRPRIEWDSFDIAYQGLGVEVKSSAYLQTWAQKKASNVTFNIAKHLEYDPESEEYGTDQVRSADCYVFCLFAEREKTNAEPRNLASWEFYVLPTTVIESEFGDQKTLALGTLRQICHPVEFRELRSEIDKALEVSSQGPVV